MNYSYRTEGLTVIFELSGNLLAETDRENIARDVNMHMERGFTRYLFDLTPLKHINSTGLGIFISLYGKIKDTEGELVLCNPSEHIRNLLLITKLDSIFKIEPTLDQAMKAFSK
jgi:anti-sigma B factor antagonist